jgi:hypothetical protein
MVTADFAKWAVGFSGCDGGNPKGDIWLCGIEFGEGHTEKDLERNLTEVDVSNPGFLGDRNWDEEEIQDFLKYPYNWKAAKLLCALAGRATETYRDFFRAERCFSRDSRYFKLNLYPIGFRNTSSEYWQDWHTRLTGFQTKSEYIQWCQAKRFLALRTWVQECFPKLIVCTGKDHRNEFFKAFTDGAAAPDSVDVAGKKIWYVVTNAGRTLVAVTYFLGGPHGLKSDPELSAAGKMLAELLRRIEPASSPDVFRPPTSTARSRRHRIRSIPVRGNPG